jgi:hypothetical protein
MIRSFIPWPAQAGDRSGYLVGIKRRRPTQAAAIRDAISLIVADPDKAERDYSIGLGDPRARYLAMPFLAPDGLI